MICACVWGSLRDQNVHRRTMYVNKAKGRPLMNILVENSVPLTLDSQADRFHTSSSHPTRRGAGTVVPCTSSEYTSEVPVSRPRSPLTTSARASSTETSTSPNIVSRLQQLHGLTKKKLYGSANYPPRTPFFTDERPDTGSYRVPAQPLIPLDVEEYIDHNYSLSNSGGKAQTGAREGRKIRLMQRNAMGPQPFRRGKTLSSNRVLPDAQSSSSLSSPLNNDHSTTAHMIIDPLAASYNTFGPSTHLPVTTHGLCKPPVDATTATIARGSWNTWEQTVSQDSYHPQSPYQWGTYLGPISSHTQKSWHPEGDDNAGETRTYLPIAPPYLSLDLSDTGVNFGKSSVTLQENRLNGCMIDVNVAPVTMNEGASPPITAEKVVPQLSEGFSYESISRLESSNLLPQFHHTSSSSLSAMINPRLDTRRSPLQDYTGESQFSNA